MHNCRSDWVESSRSEIFWTHSNRCQRIIDSRSFGRSIRNAWIYPVQLWDQSSLLRSSTPTWNMIRSRRSIQISQFSTTALHRINSFWNSRLNVEQASRYLMNHPSLASSLPEELHTLLSMTRLVISLLETQPRLLPPGFLNTKIDGKFVKYSYELYWFY